MNERKGFGFLFPLFGLFLLFGLAKAMHRHGHEGGHRHWGERGVPPMFDKWHRRAHGETQPETPAAQAAPVNV